MQGINIFLSDKLRLHPLEFTADGLGMACSPYIVLEPEVSDEKLQGAIEEAFAHSRSGLPPRPVTKAEEKAYFKALGIKSFNELGIGVDVSLEDGIYTVRPVDKKGLMGEGREVEAEALIEVIRKLLKLGGALGSS